MCVLIFEHDIACALRRGVALVGVFLTRIAHLIVGPPFMCRLCIGG